MEIHPNKKQSETPGADPTLKEPTDFWQTQVLTLNPQTPKESTDVWQGQATP